MKSYTSHIIPFITLTPLFFLSGCGDIEIPASIPTPIPTPIVTTTPTPTTINTSQTPTPNTANACKTIKEERDGLAEAVTVSQKALETCEAEKKQLQSLSYNASTTTNQIQQLSPILKRYIKETKQEEYKFDICQSVATAKNHPWFHDFETALQNSTLYFSALQRPLKTSDFYSVCSSNEGKTALFLGAKAEGKTEFHMLKYKFDTKKLSSAILLNGTCDLCPNKFGKRFGPYITLTASYGNAKKTFNYYYDINLIEEK